MEYTRTKLEEANFFLGKMKEFRGQPEFLYFLNAFLVAARATTNILQSEYASGDYSELFLRWYGEEKDNSQYPRGSARHRMRQDNFCNFFYKLRSAVIKDGPPMTDDIVVLASRDDEPVGASITRFDGEKMRFSTTSTSLVEIRLNKESVGSPPIQHADVATSAKDYEFSVYYYFSDFQQINVPSAVSSVPICEAASNYLGVLENIISEWGMFVNGEISKEELLDKISN